LKRPALGPLTGPLPRRDIVAICAFLNRSKRRPVDASTQMRAILLDKVADAARMQ
jgi:hypothetical protein